MDETKPEFDGHSGGASYTLPLSSEPDPPPKHPFTKAKFQIGSCKGPQNFPFSTSVFHPDDVPAHKRKNKMAVKVSDDAVYLLWALSPKGGFEG